MATKAELEAELATLRAQLKESQAQAKETPEDPREEEPDEQPSEGIGFELPEGVAKDLVNELESFAKDKPLVTILAAFVVGYALGRGR